MDIIFADSMRILQFAFISKTIEQGRIPTSFVRSWYPFARHIVEVNLYL